MSRYGRNPADVKLDLAHAFAEGLDPLEYLQQQSEARSR